MTSITRPNEFKRAVAAHGRRANHEPTWVPTAAVGLGLLAALLLAAQAGATNAPAGPPTLNQDLHRVAALVQEQWGGDNKL